MARTRAADHEAQRERILERAVQAFARIGFPSASMSELALACGTSKAGLYHYFASKEELLYEALMAYTDRLVQIAAGVEQKEADARLRLRRLVREFLAEYQHAHHHHVALLNDLKFLSPARREPLVQRQREVIDVFQRALVQAHPQRMAVPEQRRAVTMALLGTINFTFAWWRRDGSLSPEAFADLVIDIWERGL